LQIQVAALAATLFLFRWIVLSAAGSRPDTKPVLLIYRETSKNGGFKERENMTRQETESEVRASDNPGPRRMLNEKQVLAIVPVSPVTLWRLEKAGKFPRSTYISPNRRVWFEDEIIKWQNAVNEFNPNRRRGKGRGRRASTSPA
jgi:predicted DNA-binding transcriptional regulator AlpA